MFRIAISVQRRPSSVLYSYKYKNDGFLQTDEIGSCSVQFVSWIQDAKNRMKEQLNGKAPDEILGLHSDSFKIPYENVRSIKLSRLSVAGTLSQGRLAGTLEISALWRGSEKKFKFSIPKERFEEVKEIVYRYLHEKVVAK